MIHIQAIHKNLPSNDAAAAADDDAVVATVAAAAFVAAPLDDGGAMFVETVQRARFSLSLA